MTKMKFETPDLTSENIEKIAALFPNCITEMLDEERSTPEKKVYKRAINFEMLKQMLSPDVVDGDEAYEFTWVGKKAAIVEANKPIRKTLRPCPEESKNWDDTENLYIEGDNLEVLKLLQESYLGKVKMIYIDPPYNTGSDFVYADDFMRSQKEEDAQMGMYDEDENRLFKNLNTNGKFHSDWCSMVYSRLMLARNLLSENGVIFASIDDNEQENLKKLCNEVFGEDNFIAQVVWERAYSPVNLKKHFSESHDYILCYAKNIAMAVCNGLPRSSEANDRYSNPDSDPRGDWKASDLSVGPIVQSKVYEIITPSGRRVLPPNGYCWRLDRKTFDNYVRDNRIWFGSDGNNVPAIKRFLSEVKQGITPMTIWKYSEVGHSQDATKRLKDLFGGSAYFDYPKPVDLIKRALQLYSLDDSLVLDFFSGSATTAHAVMQLNAEDGGHRKFIMVQLPEKCDEASEAYKTGYKNICEIGKERIRRAGDKIKAEHPDAQLDTGFRVFRVDESNMEDVYYHPEELTQTMLGGMVSNIKSDRSDLDLLYACLLDWGVEINLPHSAEALDGCTIHNVDDGALVACFDENVPDTVIRRMADLHPLRAVFRDSSFASDDSKINVTEIFKNLSPDTNVKVI